MQVKLAPSKSVHLELTVNTSYVGILSRRREPAGKVAFCMSVIVYEVSAEFWCEALVTYGVSNDAGVSIWTVIPVVLFSMAALELLTKSRRELMMRVFVGFVQSDSIRREMKELAGMDEDCAGVEKVI